MMFLYFRSSKDRSTDRKRINGSRGLQASANPLFASAERYWVRGIVIPKQRKRLPDMRGWSDERVAEFCETHDSTEYLDEMKDVDVKIDVPDFRMISLRLEKEDVEKAKALARQKGIKLHSALPLVD